MRIGAAGSVLLLAGLLACLLPPGATAQAAGYALTLGPATFDREAPLAPGVDEARLATVARIECGPSGPTNVPPLVGWYLEVGAGSESAGVEVRGPERVPVQPPDCATDTAREVSLHHDVSATEQAPALQPIKVTVHARLVNGMVPAPPSQEAAASAFASVAYVGRLQVATGVPEERDGAVHVPVHLENLGNLATAVRVLASHGEARWDGAEPVLETKATGGADTFVDGTVAVRGGGRAFTLLFVPVAAAHPEHQGPAVQSSVALPAAAPPSPGAQPALIALSLCGAVAALGLRRPRA